MHLNLRIKRMKEQLKLELFIAEKPAHISTPAERIPIPHKHLKTRKYVF